MSSEIVKAYWTVRIQEVVIGVIITVVVLLGFLIVEIIKRKIRKRDK